MRVLFLLAILALVLSVPPAAADECLGDSGRTCVVASESSTGSGDTGCEADGRSHAQMRAGFVHANDVTILVVAHEGCGRQGNYREDWNHQTVTIQIRDQVIVEYGASSFESSGGGGHYAGCGGSTNVAAPTLILGPYSSPCFARSQLINSLAPIGDTLP